jgi:hypothetical protein
MTIEGRTWMGAAGLGAVLLLSGCNTPSFQAVSVRPIYGWADGCNAVTVNGSGFEDDVAVTVDGDPLMGLTLPDGELDVGYTVSGVIPPKDLSASAYATITVTSGGESDDVLDQFYRLACPAPVNVEDYGPDAGLAAGTTVELYGCHILDTHKVQIGGTEATITNASTCDGGTDAGTFAAPDVADGDWYIGIYDSAGTEIYPALDNGCDVSLPVGTSTGTDDEGNEIDLCDGTMMVTYGGEG